MNIERTAAIKDLLESSDQLHLTIYLEGQGGVAQLKRQLRSALAESQAELRAVFSPEEREVFLSPIKACLDDDRMLAQFSGSLGIFRTRSSFRVLSLPVAVTFGCHVASTFHVKPLLRWMQWDSDFFLLGFDSGSAHLFHGTQSTLRKIDSALFPRTLESLLVRPAPLTFEQRKALRAEMKSACAWLDQWVSAALAGAGARLFLAGDERLTRTFRGQSGYRRTVQLPVASCFSEDSVSNPVAMIRSQLREQARTHLQQAILTFQVAEDMKVAKGGLSQIAKAVADGRVSKLIIAENFEVFGKLDAKSGKLSIHPYDMDHEDDDLLDDLAQAVLASGGEVFIAKRDQIPGRAPILAITDPDPRAAAAPSPAVGAARRVERSAV